MTSTPTPPPWHTCCLPEIPHYVFGPNGDETICAMHYNDPKDSHYDPHSGIVTIKQCRANGRLIRAAPDLLYALQAMLNRDDLSCYPKPLLAQARAAIQKATD